MLRMIRTVNSDYFCKPFSGVVIRMHIAYYKEGTEILNTWYNRLYIQNFNK